MDIKQIKKKFKKIWNFLAHDDSWASFVADLIIIIVLAKFVIYPAIGLVMGNSFPVVAVVSGSMDHNDLAFDEWWEAKGNYYENIGVSKEEFSNFYLSNGFKKGDVLIIKKGSNTEYSIGDIIVFHESSRPNPIIHRIIDKSEMHVSTKGDANSQQISFEKSIPYSKIEGKAVFIIPKIGWVKVGAVELLNYLL